jgi:uncharacterized protein YdiU (UPF0061 family)
LFYQKAQPAAFPQPRLAVFNHRLASELGLDFQAESEAALSAVFSGQTIPPGARPIAQAYAGHQFGHFTSLGDGRAILLGEHVTPSGQRVDIQLKGAGRTPYSRRGDGLAALGPMLREYIISEAMSALGVPTTRSLAVVMTGQSVHREEILAGAVLTRTAASHIRVGTFEWVAAHQDQSALRALADYTQKRHYPQITAAGEEKYLALLAAIIEKQAHLIAQWQSLGFIHGVMNTDNMALSGETIDYGPCAFMDHYYPKTVFSSIDRQGRYAYGNQPTIAQWNLARLAEAMLPILHPEASKAIEHAELLINDFADQFAQNWLKKMRQKLGLFTAEEEDLSLVKRWLAVMQTLKLDFTLSFRSLAHAQSELRCAEPIYQEWHTAWRARLSRQPQTTAEVTQLMQANNPAVIPRNHRVEEVLAAAVAQLDFQPLHCFVQALSQPFSIENETSDYAQPPPPSWTGYQTFCGT